jgi:hypothetical protein
MYTFFKSESRFPQPKLKQRDKCHDTADAFQFRFPGIVLPSIFAAFGSMNKQN